MKSRSRGGCAACLKQHKKCDESRPICSRCCRLAIDCDYKIHLRWFHCARLPRRRRENRLPGEAISKARSPQLQDHNQQLSLLGRLDNGSLSIDTPEVPLIGAPYSESSQPQGEHLHHSREHHASGSSFGVLAAQERLPLHGQCKMRDRNDGIDSIERENTNTMTRTYNELSYSRDIENPIKNPEDERSRSTLASDHFTLCGLTGGDLSCVLFESRDQYHTYLYFVKCVALIIPAWGNGLRNGYKQVAKSAISSPVLLDTLVSVSSAYMHLRGIVPYCVALRSQSHAIASLRRSVDSLTVPEAERTQDLACLKRDVLATLLLQVTVEMAHGTSFIHAHITYALRLFKDLGYDKHRPTSSVGVVLVQRMTYIDVLSSVFWRRRPLLPLNFWFFEDECRIDETTPSFQQTTGCPLWVTSTLAAISHLVADLDDGASEDIVFSRAMELESTLTRLAQLHFSIGSGLQYDADDSPYLNIVCECYYWSAVIILQRRVFKGPRHSRRIQFCLTKLIDLLDSLPLGCGPDSQLSLPLYVAAYVATSQQHRDRLQRKSSNLSQVYPLKARTVLTAAFEDMWNAADSQGDHHCTYNPMDPDLMKEKTLFVC